MSPDFLILEQALRQSVANRYCRKSGEKVEGNIGENERGQWGIHTEFDSTL